MIKFVSNSLRTPTNSELANQGGNCPSLSPPCYVRAAVTSQQSNGETMRATKAAKLQLACFSFNGFSPDSQQRYNTLETHLQPSSKSNESMLLLCAAAAVDAVQTDLLPCKRSETCSPTTSTDTEISKCSEHEKQETRSKGPLNAGVTKHKPKTLVSRVTSVSSAKRLPDRVRRKRKLYIPDTSPSIKVRAREKV